MVEQRWNFRVLVAAVPDEVARQGIDVQREPIDESGDFIVVVLEVAAYSDAVLAVDFVQSDGGIRIAVEMVEPCNMESHRVSPNSGCGGGSAGSLGDWPVM